MKVLLIDDHPLIRDAVAGHLSVLSADLDVWHAGDCAEGFQALAEKGPADLVLIDLVLPGMSGLEGLRKLDKDYPKMPVVALSSSDDKATVEAVFDAKAMGFLPKSSTAAEILDALRLVLGGGVYIPDHIYRRGAASLGAPSPSVDAAAAAAPSEAAGGGPHCYPADLGLTPRQADVLYQIVKGKNIKQIAIDMNLAIGTVKSHTSAVLRALNVTTRMQALVAMSRLKLCLDDAAQRSASKD